MGSVLLQVVRAELTDWRNDAKAEGEVYLRCRQSVYDGD